MRKALISSCAAFMVLFGVGSAQAHSGSKIWGGWKFDWQVRDNAGLALRDLYFNNELVAFKISMPAIRVRYYNNVRYLDRINWNNMRIVKNCNGTKVCMKEFSYEGRNWLEIGVVARIGEYRLHQVYFLSHDGWIHVELASRGLHHLVTHDHHVYWRFDFYINFNPGEQILTRAPLTILPDKINSKEFDAKRGTSTPPNSWLIRDPAGGHGVLVYRSWWADGPADAFSSLDVAGRLYKPSEDIGWQFGVNGELGYNEEEDIQNKDSVFWYVGHLHHEVKPEDITCGLVCHYHGSNEWHKTGAQLYVKR